MPFPPFVKGVRRQKKGVPHRGAERPFFVSYQTAM